MINSTYLLETILFFFYGNSLVALELNWRAIFVQNSMKELLDSSSFLISS